MLVERRGAYCKLKRGGGGIGRVGKQLRLNFQAGGKGLKLLKDIGFLLLDAFYLNHVCCKV